MLKKLIYFWLISQLIFTTYYYDSTDPYNLFVNITPDRVLFLLIVVVYFSNIITKKIVLKRIQKIEVLMVILISVCTISLLISGGNLDITRGENRWLSTLFSFLVAPFFMFHISTYVFREKRDIINIIKVVSGIGIYLAITGAFEHYRIDEYVFPSYIMDRSLGLHWDRARGPFLNSGINGRILIFGFISVLFLIIHYRGIKQKVLMCSLLPIVSAIYWTYTRGIWLGFAGAILPFSFLKSPFRKYAIFMCCLVFIGMFSGLLSKFSTSGPTLFQKRETTIDDRLNLMYAAARMIGSKPIFGWGYGKFNFVSPRYFKKIEGVELRGEGEGNHNTPLGLFAEVGLIGFIPYMAILYIIALNSKKLLSKGKHADNLRFHFGLIFLSGFLMYLITMQAGDIRWNTLQNSIFFIYFGIAYEMNKS